MPEKKKKDHLEMAKGHYYAAKTYDLGVDRGRIQCAQALALIVIAEELRELREMVIKLTEDDKITGLVIIEKKGEDPI